MLYDTEGEGLGKVMRVSGEIEFVTDISNQRVVVIKALDKHDRFGIRIGQILVADRVAIGRRGTQRRG